MKEAHGNIWDHIDEYDAVVITTNGFVKKNGEAVMGRGIALEAKEKFPQLPKWLGTFLLIGGNRVHSFTVPKYTNGPLITILTMPVKPSLGPRGEPGWRVKADPYLIERSAKQLQEYMRDLKVKIIMPRPGCGNGGLGWEKVKPLIEPYLDDRFTVMERYK